MNTSSSLVASLGAVVAFAACSGKIVDNNPGEVDAPLPIDARPPPPIPADCLEAANRGLAWLVTRALRRAAAPRG